MEDLDSIEGVDHKILNVFRENEKILTHTIFKEEGDCSSINIELGNYSIVGNEIVFYSYWAVTDRMPIFLAPYGFQKKIYSVNNSGLIKFKEATIYIEDYVENNNKNLFEDNGWKHKGLKYLYEKPKNKSEQKLLKAYIKSIENKYKAKFVLDNQKILLEKEVRLALKDEIHENTKSWEEGEVYGKVKK